MTQTAFKAAERTKKLDMLGTATVPEEFKELVANMSTIEGGDLKVSIPTFDEATKKMIPAIKSAADLNQDDFKALKEQQSKNEMSDREIAMEQLTALQEIAGANQSAKAATTLVGVKTDGVIDALGGLDAYAEVVREGLDASINEENLKIYGNALTQNIAEGFQDEEARKHFKNAAFNISSTFGTAIETSLIDMNDKLPETNLMKDSGLSVEDFITAAYQSTESGLTEFKTKMEGLIPDSVLAQLTTAKTLFGNFSDIVGDLATNAAMFLGENIDDAAAGTPDTSADTTSPVNQDFISRPGMPVQRFLKDDIIIGGTSLLENMDDTGNNVNGEINLNVGGKIDLSVDGRNLPQNISSEQLANEIVNNPTFTSKLMTILTDSNNTYSA